MRPRAFFLPAADGGQRYCLHHPARGVPRASLLYAPPYGDEMNKARRMAAMQARALADHGVEVLQIDLLGCGDSSGDAGDARWPEWLDDLALAADWLAGRTGHAPQVLGLRLGGLLALDFVRQQPRACAGVILWQPVTDGAAFITQLYRQRLASAMLDETQSAPAGASVASLRARQLAGEPLEIGGYLLDPALAHAIAATQVKQQPPRCRQLHWYDIGAAGRAPSPATASLLQQWHDAGVTTRYTALDGDPFWHTPETTTCELLVTATVVSALAHIQEPDHAL